MYIFKNPNPRGAFVGDCVIRALSIALENTWENTYIRLCAQGLQLCDLPSSNRVWGDFLKSKGYSKHIIPDTCPGCYTVRDFCEDHPEGTFILGTGSHVVAVIDGNYCDAWDSGDETPIYYFKEEE